MSQFIIQGGHKLKGEIRVSGAKNAATPILAATLLTQGECVIGNVPRVSDVETMIEILRSLRAEAEWSGPHELTVSCRNVSAQSLDKKLVKRMRSSILLLGPMLARFQEVTTTEPGGCLLGSRPIDSHLFVLRKLGAEITRQGEFYHLKTKGLVGATIILPEFSVTATENALMAAARATGQTVIKLAAAEPHVTDLARFLIKMGAKIKGLGTHTLTIQGVKKLRGAKHRIIPDQIEVGSFVALALATRSRLTISPVVPEDLDSVFSLIMRTGSAYEARGHVLKIIPQISPRPFKLQALPFPGFPTDLQAPWSVLATQCQGTSLIHDPLYEGRMGHIAELIKMGANAIICDPHRVLITGVTPLHGQEIKSFNLRSGATLIIAGLLAQGETIINEAEVVYRGYERIDERLRQLGAKIVLKS